MLLTFHISNTIFMFEDKNSLLALTGAQGSRYDSSSVCWFQAYSVFKEKLKKLKEESEFSVLLEMEWWYQHLYARLNPKSSMKTISQWKWWIGSISGGSIRIRFSSSFWTHLIMKWKLNVTFWLPQYFEKWFILCSPILNIERVFDSSLCSGLPSVYLFSLFFLWVSYFWSRFITLFVRLR